jgi:hypothetical protein
VTISRAVQDYIGEVDEHHRYRSWEHCYSYFRKKTGPALAADREHAALQLAFYLASWGMYRGSGFLLQYAYTVHRSVIDVLAEPRFVRLRGEAFGLHTEDVKLIPLVMQLIAALKAAYMPFSRKRGSGQPTDTLITKVVLGTVGCLPACDRYFIDGFKSKGYPYSALNPTFLVRILEFALTNATELQNQQRSLEKSCGLRYPVMKIVDMYFWQLGYERDPNFGNRRASGSS